MNSPKTLRSIDASIELVLHHLNISELSGKRLFITGGTGFFGFWLLSTLKLVNDLGTGINVTVLSRAPQRFLKKYPQFRSQKWLTFIQGNVRDFDFPTQRFNLLIHAATETSASAHANPLAIFDDIVIGTRHTLDFAIKSGVERALLISSGAVYGTQPVEVSHISEDSSLACSTDNSTNAYGEGKRCMEMLGTLYAQQYGLNVTSARCFAFVGPELPLQAHFAIGNFIYDALYADNITVKGDGTPIRSYLYGGDLAVWLLTLLLRGISGRTYNVGSDVAISIRDLALLVRDTLSPGKPVEILEQPNTGNGKNVYLPCIKRARCEFGLDVWTPVQGAICLTAEGATGLNKEALV